MEYRLPRPTGLTQLCLSLNKSRNQQEFESIKTQVIRVTISSYVQNGFSMMGKPMSMIDLAQFLGVSSKRILKEMSRFSKNLASITSPEQIQETIQAIMGLTLQQAMMDRSITQKQANMLIAAQNGEYAPFLTKEANVAIRSLQDSNKIFIDILKALQGPNQINIQNQLQKEEEPNEAELLTVEKAVFVLNEQNSESLLENPLKQEQLMLTEKPDDLMEVIATKQKGFELQASKVSQDITEFTKKKKHIERNEDDADIVDAEEIK